MWKVGLKAESEVLSQTAACRDTDEARKTYIRTATSELTSDPGTHQKQKWNAKCLGTIFGHYTA